MQAPSLGCTTVDTSLALSNVTRSYIQKVVIFKNKWGKHLILG